MAPRLLAAGMANENGSGGPTDRAARRGKTQPTSPRGTQTPGSTSKIPKPPRTAVLPLLNGSHAKPTRGAKFLSVGFFGQRVFDRHGGSAVNVFYREETIVIFRYVGRRLVAHAKVQSQVRAEAPIVLHIRAEERLSRSPSYARRPNLTP